MSGERRKGILDVILEGLQGVRAPPRELPPQEAPPVEAPRKPRPRARRTSECRNLPLVLATAVAWGRAYENPSIAREMGMMTDEILGTGGQAVEIFTELASASASRRDTLTREFLKGLKEYLGV
jgi:hypothetical protein